MDRNQSLLPKFIWLVLTLCILRLWIVQLPSSFWVDETGTFFVVEQGAHHPSFAAAPQVPASIYYWLPRTTGWLLRILPQRPGVMETAYRLPSVFAMGFALLLIARIAARLIHPDAAWFAVFACLALRGVDYEAADARPYAFGILVVSASAFFLIRWLDHGRARDAVVFVVLAAAVWWVHLLFWPFYLVLLGYAAVRLFSSETAIRWETVLLAFVVIAIVLIPVLLEALQLSRHAGEHVISPVPPVKELLRELKLGLIFLSAALAWLLRARVNHPSVHSARPTAGVLILLWWLLPPIALFVFSKATGNSVFVHRYLSFSLPGVALAATAAAAFFMPDIRWNRAAAVLGVGVFAFLSDWSSVWPVHHNSNWRAAAASINALPDKQVPVLCMSPFVEAKAPAWSPQYQLPGFLYAHLAAYPVHGNLVLFPFQTSPEAQRWAASLAIDKRFILYGPAPSAEFWRTWYLRQPRFQSWTSHKIGDFGDVSAVMVSAR